MRITRLIATPHGDRDFGETLAGVPLEGCPELTYGAYFQALEAFLLQGGEALAQALAAGGAPDGLASLRQLVLRAEKHGALYHPASVEAVWPGGSMRLCLNVAASPVAVACLEQEVGLLAGLRQRYTPEFLPRPYGLGRVGGLAVLLEDWFEGYHEFHRTRDGRLRLWDFGAGERELPAETAWGIAREAARILTRYYDPDTGACIGPWSHAAGDFVARLTESGPAVRLITVRGHAPARDFSEAGPMAPKLAGLSFFLNMTMAMRLDRVDGVGEAVLAEEAVAEAATVGFRHGWRERAVPGERVGDLLDFLASFSAAELAMAAEGLAEPVAPDETALVAAAWPGHAAALHRALTAGLGRA